MNKTLSTHANSPFEVIEFEFQKLMESHDAITGRISSSVSFSDAELEDAKDQLAEFVIKSNQIANSRSLKERTLRIMGTIPMIGKKAAAKAHDIRKENLNSKSITEVVDQLFNGIKHRAESLENAIKQMYKIQEETVSLISRISVLDTRLDEMLTEAKQGAQRLSLIKISSQIKIMLSNSHDKVQELSVITKVAEGVLLNIFKILPVSRSELLSRIVMDAGVSQINAIHQDVKDIMELNHTITENMNNKTRSAIMHLLDSSSVSQEDVNRIKKATDDRMRLMSDIASAAQRYEQNIQTTHEAIVQHVDAANRNRLLLNNNSSLLQLTTNNSTEDDVVEAEVINEKPKRQPRSTSKGL